MTPQYEQQHAIREAKCNRAAEDYFSARSLNHSLLTEDAFTAGFYRGYDAAIALDRQQPRDLVAWTLTQQQVMALAEQLIVGAQTMGGADDDGIESDVRLMVRIPGAVSDDDGKLNERPVLAFCIDDYPEEGVYPIDPTDCKPTYEQPLQPAEPVKVPSDEELLDFYHARTKNEIRHTDRTILPLLSDLLERYGSASGHLQELKNAIAATAELRQQLDLMGEQVRGEVWRWQGDGTNNLATMGNHMGVLIYACDLRALLAQHAASAESVEYQARIRPDWIEDKPDNWSEWERCTAEEAADYERTPLLRNWRYQVRRIYTAAIAAQPSVPDHLIERLRKHCNNKENTAFARSTMREVLGYLAPTPPASDGQAQQDSQTSDEANIQHAENCNDDGCDRCNALLEFYMACDNCGRIGNKDASGWTKEKDQFFCAGCSQQDTDAARDVLAERQRQIEAEGWTQAHDDEHGKGEMAGAAACYAVSSITHWAKDHVIRTLWPWSPEWWKPSDPRRNLVKAGALVLAEIERLDRAAARAQQTGEHHV